MIELLIFAFFVGGAVWLLFRPPYPWTDDNHSEDCDGLPGHEGPCFLWYEKGYTGPKR